MGTMLAFVGKPRALGQEASVTNTANIKVLARVCLFVETEGFLVGKRPWTEITLVGFLTGMAPEMTE